jgi:hypothetical protein
MHAHKRLDIDVRIHTLDIGERMVINVMFDFPEVRNSAKQIQ